MSRFDTEFHAERIAASAFIAPNAVVIGDVTIGEWSSVWYNAVLRGDVESISVGSRANIQDGCILHADEGLPCRLGDGVTVGHAAIVHGARVDSGTLIGMRAVVMNRAHVAAGCIVGAGAVVTEGTIVPPNSLVLGMPARVVRETTNEEQTRIKLSAAHYVEAATAARQ